MVARGPCSGFESRAHDACPARSTSAQAIVTFHYRVLTREMVRVGMGSHLRSACGLLGGWRVADRLLWADPSAVPDLVGGRRVRGEQHEIPPC